MLTLLPKSPVTQEGVLLVPSRFLKDIPVVTPDSFWIWADATVGTDQRQELNYELSIALSKDERKDAGYRSAWRHPDLVMSVLDRVSETVIEPYDVERDPKRLVRWAEVGRNAAAQQKPVAQLDTATQFAAWVVDLAKEFQRAVEDTDLWKVLWDDGLRRNRPEKIVQAIAGMFFAAHCRMADVDPTRESNLGRGPVDFKFSQGWHKRALLEVKLVPSTHFFTGASKQLPQYTRTERTSVGVYLCIVYSDKDFSPARIQPIQDTLHALRKASGWTIGAIFVDARKTSKASASKLR